MVNGYGVNPIGFVIGFSTDLIQLLGAGIPASNFILTVTTSLIPKNSARL